VSGKVYLVGAGPGDPELLTLKGARCLGQAQAVVYDFLANPALLDLAPAGAERIYVGKKGGDHTLSQEEINRLLCDLGRAGKIVVRLKGGDPFVFGRGGEEASALAAADVSFEVVPGVTSAIAAPAYAGIPVTDRRCSTEVAFITGHEDPTKEGSSINWPALAGLKTLVFLMGVKNLPDICAQLIDHGKSPQTPAAAVRWGTTSQQKTITGTLNSLPRLVSEAGLKPPAIFVVGDVVGLRPEIAWFEKLPLFGKRVLVTRTRKQASKLSHKLRAMGAEVLEIPTIAIKPPADPGPLSRAAAQAESYDWLIFTSANGVTAFLAALQDAGKDVRALAGARLAAIGPATAQALTDQGLLAEVTAESFVAEGLLEALKNQGLAGKRILLPRAAKAREVLPETLRQWGAVVEVVPAYESVVPPDSGPKLAEALARGVEVITFTASSTVENLMALVSPAERERLQDLSAQGKLIVAAIGPVTAETARRHGLTVQVVPEAYTIDSFVRALAAYFGKP